MDSYQSKINEACVRLHDFSKVVMHDSVLNGIEFTIARARHATF